MTHKKDLGEFRYCPHCHRENPLTAFCCLHCFKLMRPKVKVPWYKVSLKASYPVGIALCALAIFGIYLIKCWMENLEAQVSMNFRTEDYSVSITADKKTK